MQTLRNARWITRIVLVWFALFIGAAVASPLLKPGGEQVVCTAMGSLRLVSDQGGSTPAPAPMKCLNCPLCAPVVGLLLTPWSVRWPMLAALQQPSVLTASPFIPRVAVAHLPPRGPPIQA